MRLPRPKTRKKRMFTRLVLQIYQETWRNTSCVCLSLQLGKSFFLCTYGVFFLLVEQSEMPEGISRTRLMSILRGYGEFPAKYRSVAGRLSALGYRTNTHQDTSFCVLILSLSLSLSLSISLNLSLSQSLSLQSFSLHLYSNALAKGGSALISHLSSAVKVRVALVLQQKLSLFYGHETL